MQARRNAMALTPLGPAVATVSVIATSAMILGACKTTTPRLLSCLLHRPRPPGIAHGGMQARRNAMALTPLGPTVATVSVIATIAAFLTSSTAQNQQTVFRPATRGEDS